MLMSSVLNETSDDDRQPHPSQPPRHHHRRRRLIDIGAGTSSLGVDLLRHLNADASHYPGMT